MSDEHKVYIVAIGLMFALGALGGFGALVRGKEPINSRTVAAATINGAMLSVAIVAINLSYFGVEWVFLCGGLSAIASLGGNATLTVVVKLWNEVAQAIVRTQSKKLDE